MLKLLRGNVCQNQKRGRFHAGSNRPLERPVHPPEAGEHNTGQQQTTDPVKGKGCALAQVEVMRMTLSCVKTGSHIFVREKKNYFMRGPTSKLAIRSLGPLSGRLTRTTIHYQPAPRPPASSGQITLSNSLSEPAGTLPRPRFRKTFHATV